MPSNPKSTWASVITPPGEGGIGIVALGGPDAAAALARFFRPTHGRTDDLPVGGIAYGHIVRDGQTVDEVIVTCLDGAASPAGELFYEVNCHGGPVAVQTVLDCFRSAGAEVVPWQEIGGGAAAGAPVLSPGAIRTAALALLPRAETRLAARMLLHQASGALARALEELRRRIEAGEQCAEVLRALLATAPLGRALLRPPSVLLAGPPNAGKSTLLNALLRRERVIVHPHPGTTRDVVRETVSLGGVPFELMDSAGLRSGGDEVERLAIQKTTEMLGRSDVVLFVYDARRPAARELAEIPAIAPAGRWILVANKIDLLAALPEADPVPDAFLDAPRLFVSAREGRGIEQVESALLAPYRDQLEPCAAGAPMVFTPEMAAALRQVEDALSGGDPKRALGELNALTAR